MTDIEKVIKELEEISDYFFDIYRKEKNGYSPAQEYCNAAEDAIALLKQQEAAYQGVEELLRQKTILFDDAIKRLKEQEPKQVIGISDFTEGIEVGYCPSCGRGIVNKKINETKFCKFCGQAVSWDD